MRREWTQREVIEMGKILGFKNFDRRSLEYWDRMGVFPKPKAELKGVLVLYDSEEIEVGLVDIGRRLRNPIHFTYDDVKEAKSEVLRTNKAKNVSMLLRKIKERSKKIS